jgi:probable phosphoglycerate mutase
MKFTLVRHGEVESARPALDGGRENDPGLTSFGRRQAAALANELMAEMERDGRIEAIYTSPLRAARTTAEALSAVLDAGDPRVAAELTVLSPSGRADGDLPDVEAVQERAWRFLLDLKAQYDQRSTVILVTDDLAIRALVCKALDMPLESMSRFQVDPASLTTIEFRLQRDNRERTLIAALNDTCHVEAV